MTSTVIEVDEYLARLERVLAGRKPYPWAAANGISRGTIGRMLKGELPDPARLVPVLRSEGLSLTWLLTGQGTPFVVHSPTSDAQGADLIRQYLEEMGAPSVSIIRNAEASSSLVVALTEHVSKAPADAEPYEYDHSEVIAGPRLGALSAAAAAEASAVRRATFDGPSWRRLASGYMSLIELAERIAATPALYAIAPRSAPISRVAEPEPTLGELSELEQKMIAALRALPIGVRETMVKMVEAARSK